MSKTRPTGTNPTPEITTVVPPSVGPVLGEMVVILGVLYCKSARFVVEPDDVRSAQRNGPANPGGVLQNNNTYGGSDAVQLVIVYPDPSGPNSTSGSSGPKFRPVILMTVPPNASKYMRPSCSISMAIISGGPGREHILYSIRFKHHA